MARFFNVSGPCEPERHYMLPPLRRLPTVLGHIDQGAYFVVHAPRQTGKTTALTALCRQLTAAGRYSAALVSMETGDPHLKDVGAAERAILADWRLDLRDQLSAALQPPPWPEVAPGGQIAAALDAWARSSPRPLVLVLDEIDALQDEVLRSVLRQLRSGSRRRPEAFPWSLCLCGVRDVRDYKVRSGGSKRLTTASPFNIKDESLAIRDFTPEEVGELYEQHTADTGQVFTPAAVARAAELSQGQPWLVNALARQATQNLVQDRGLPITPAHIEQAKEALILRRDTHIDSLAEKLHEDRVRKVIEPILVGDYPAMDVLNDDLMYVRDLGLIVTTPVVRIANPIYQEIIPRSLSFVLQSYLAADIAGYLHPGGGLDMAALLRAFQRFFAEHSEGWLARYDYQEAGPHLILMAFLQKLLNGGGQLQREFAAGSGRADIVVTWKGRRHVLELKIRKGERAQQDGIEQLSRYLDRLGEREGYLILFDRRPGRSWEEKLYEAEAQGPAGQQIHVFGM